MRVKILAGLCGVAGLFFYGSLTALFADEINSTSRISGALLFRVPFADVLQNGGPFTHIILSHSMVYALIGIFCVLSILFLKLENGNDRLIGPDLFVLLPGLLVTMNSIAGLGATGLAAALMIIFGYRKLKCWLSALMVILFLFFVMSVSGFIGSSASSSMSFDYHFSQNWFPFMLWFFIGLGIRIYAFKSINISEYYAVSLSFMILIIGYIGFALIINDAFDSHDLYGIKILFGVFSVFSAVLFSKEIERYQVEADYDVTVISVQMLNITKIAAIIFFCVALISYFYEIVIYGNINNYILQNKMALLLSSLIIVMSSALLYFMNQTGCVVKFCVYGMMCCYLLGFLAWVNPWINYGLGRMQMELKLTPGEVKGLRKLKENTTVANLIATNKHSIESFPRRKERSYGYGAFSERLFLLEGWEYGEKYETIFNTVKSDNDKLFSTDNVTIAKNIIRKYGISFIVSRPDTDIRISKKDRYWLKEIENTGSLKIYKVNL